MATLQLFGKAIQEILQGVSGTDLDAAGAIKVAWSSTAPGTAATASDPRWGAGGSLDASAGEQSGGNVTAGGIALTSVTVTLADPVAITAADVVYAQHASNPSARYLYGYLDLHANNRLLFVVDFGAAQDLSVGQVTLPFSTAFITGDVTP